MLKLISEIDINFYKNQVGIICWDDDKLIYDDELITPNFKAIMHLLLNNGAWNMDIIHYFEILQSSDYFTFGQIEIEVKQAVNRVLAKDGLLDLYIRNSKGEVDCIHSMLTYLINDEVKLMAREEIEKLEEIYNNLDPNTMDWN